MPKPLFFAVRWKNIIFLNIPSGSDGVVQVPGISDAEAEALVERGTAAKPIWKRVGAKRFLSGGDGAGFLAS